MYYKPHTHTKGQTDMKVITVLNQKGGVGKTTIAVNMAAHLTALGYRVRLLDADSSQGSASDWSDKNGGKYFDVSRQNIKSIRGTIERDHDFYDYIIVDCPPRADKQTGDLISNTHFLLIPVQPSPFDIWACRELVSIVHARKDATRGIAGLPEDGLPMAAFVFSNAIKRTRLINDSEEALSETGLPLLKSMTTSHNVFKRSAYDGESVFTCCEEERNPEASQQIIGITEEILEALNGEI